MLVCVRASLICARTHALTQAHTNIQVDRSLAAAIMSSWSDWSRLPRCYALSVRFLCAHARVSVHKCISVYTSAFTPMDEGK